MKKKRIGSGGPVELRYTDEEVIEALWECGGVVRATCRKLGMHTNQFYKHYRNKENIAAELKKIWTSCGQDVIDTVYSRALDGDMKAAGLYMRFSPYLKEMGWIAEEKVTVKSEKPLTEEEKQALKEELFG